MKILEYPFDSEYILKKSKSIRRELLSGQTEDTRSDGAQKSDNGQQVAGEKSNRLHKKIAVLGGSTTHDFIRILELFLLDYGIEPEFYESEYNQYYQDAMFDPDELVRFAPDLIYIHTGYRNILNMPTPATSPEQIDDMLDGEFERFVAMWEHLATKYQCAIIQNNFEYPRFRVMGNMEAVDSRGTIRFITRLNERFYQYAQDHTGFYIHDINYLSSAYGLDRWSDPAFWHMYKYMCCMQAIPEFAFNLSHIMKAIWGKNKKAFVLDLDNTLWGGIVGDDGPEGLEIGLETSLGQIYTEFQDYIRRHKDIGVLLNVDSKNEESNALAGLNHPAGVLKPDDFIVIKANWDPKDVNLTQIAQTLNILPDSMVFVDDNPAERHIVAEQIRGVAVPEIGNPEEYIRNIDKNGYFEVVALSADDQKRNDMYKANAKRAIQQASFANYRDYLLSLEMKAKIAPFDPVYYSRISQLTNKSNQFNLTTMRCTEADIERYATDEAFITLYGQLEDKFGDNGIVSLLIGRFAELDGAEIEGPDGEEIGEPEIVLHMDLWLMSCRVLKRDMEYAMLDAIVAAAKEQGISKIFGHYYKTAKNDMVREFYKTMGFELLSVNVATGDSHWMLDISGDWEKKNTVIVVD